MVLFLLVVFGFLSFTSSQISHQYHFINIRKNWTEAQRFCRENYTDLATVNNADEMNSLFKTISDVSYDVYIGLYRSEVFRWHWSLPDSYNVETFQNWKDKQPDINNNEGCAVMDNNGKWFNDSCDSQRQFICFDATANQKYILIEVNKSWREAQEYCRTFHTDLANARNSSENHDVKNTFKKDDVWMGLFKDPWSWSDQSNSSFRFWNSSQLINIRRDQDCVSVMVNQTGKWKDVQCNATQPFICFSATPGAATTTEHRPAQNTTEGGNTSSHPTQILTTGPEQDNLILVHENLTWTEAVSYCRKHHVDLVSIHSEELQNRVVKKAIHASTSHVWLGLRYTCTFNFWFWIKNSEAGCYQNWASGHGPHGYEECRLSGALESTGGHRWVGRPESERLNFICHTCACKLCTDAF